MRFLNLMGAVLVALTLAGDARAQEGTDSARYSGGGQGWSILSGKTVGQGNTLLTGQVGWPGLGVGLLHGANDRFDIGGRFAFNYGVQRMVEIVDPGIALTLLTRFNFLESRRFNLGMTFEPGLFFDFDENLSSSPVGMDLPLGLQLGFPVGSTLMVHGGIDLPFFITFGSGGGLWVPVLLGGGLEYFVDRNLAVNFKMRMGPTFEPRRFRGRNDAFFTLESLVGLSYRL